MQASKQKSGFFCSGKKIHIKRRQKCGVERNEKYRTVELVCYEIPLYNLLITIKITPTTTSSAAAAAATPSSVSPPP
jgi:hypothetical protein